MFKGQTGSKASYIFLSILAVAGMIVGLIQGESELILTGIGLLVLLAFMSWGRTLR